MILFIINRLSGRDVARYIKIMPRGRRSTVRVVLAGVDSTPRNSPASAGQLYKYSGRVPTSSCGAVRPVSGASEPGVRRGAPPATRRPLAASQPPAFHVFLHPSQPILHDPFFNS
ncbi:unnamed protein product [Danaus chrysippus]|uniref:(African queen) hypothetical protein n=1 Tax=Danaus chrysippus TaxID=151541 RepID=A0A8J2WF12_9NEOP|nr:unnamed protein product [Danaus chrysippus]